MDVAVVSEARFSRMPDGSVWADGGSYRLWARYLRVFDSVRIIARVADAPAPGTSSVQVSGPGVQFAPVPYYLGPTDYLRHFAAVRSAVRSGVQNDGAIVMRLGSVLAGSLVAEVRRTGRPYGVEVVGDPWDVFGPGVIRHPARPLFRRYFSRLQRRLCRQACAAAYVTDQTLQRRYPCRGPEFAVSDVELADSGGERTGGAPNDFVDAAPRRDYGRGQLTLVTVASLAQPYKGVDTLIDALAILKRTGLACRLSVIGDGAFRLQLEERARSAGVEARFLGVRSRPEVLRELDHADVFLLGSRTEGLPRALLEAMARGLCCIATNVGGIPELLPDRMLCDANRPDQIADRLCALASGRLDGHAEATNNLTRARQFAEPALTRVRDEFLGVVQDVTKHWLVNGPTSVKLPIVVRPAGFTDPSASGDRLSQTSAPRATLQ